jgi:hypothetical protein
VGEDKETRTMQRKFTTIVFSLLVLSFMLSIQLAASAQASFHRAAINGLYHLGGSPAATGFNVSAMSINYGNGSPTITSGTIIVASSTLFVSSAVASITVNTLVIGGVAYKHSTVVGASYMYNGSKAHVVLELTAYSPLGEVGFMIVRDSDAAVMAASWPNGFYQQIPLQTGGLSIL